MKKTRLLFIIFLMIQGQYAEAQKQHVIINGRIDTTIINKYKSNEIVVKVDRHFMNDANQDEVVTSVIAQDGSFRMVFDAPDSLFYVSFWLRPSTHWNGDLLPLQFPARFSRLKETYLFQDTDSIHLQGLKNGNFSFRGRGSEKLNCQHQIYLISPEPESVNSRIATLHNANDYEQATVLEKEVHNMVIQMRLSLLATYRNTLSKDIYNRIYLDAIASALYTKVMTLSWNYNFGSSIYSVPAAKDYYEAYLKSNYTAGVDSAYMAESAYYADLLFQKELNRFTLYNREGLEQQGEFAFGEFYEHIKIHYQGKLRDRLLLIAFLSLNKHQVESRYFTDDALATMQDTELKKRLTSWYDKQFMAYPFELEDIHGKIHRLSDYRGKLLVIDFWYTGCMWCAVLNAAMHSIVEKYADRQDVVFLTISIDKDKEKWIKSVENGAYTSPGTIDLYTNGEGKDHPVIKYYNYTSFPKQLIIGKKGEIVTASPPRPALNLALNEMQRDETTGGFSPDATAAFTSESSKAFMKIIDDYLADN